ncbi:MAG TPA: carboxypeptidase regulatory-like domain-containing protein [Armatimonadota bacterium]
MNLTPGSYEPDNQARISANGARIVYRNLKGQYDLSYTYDNVFTMNLDGSGKYELQIFSYYGGNEDSPSISSDGTKVLLQQSSRSAGQNGLFQATVNPFATLQLNDAATYVGDTNPVYSSDASKIAFLSYRNTGASNYQAFYMNAAPENDGGGNAPVQITNWSDGKAAQLSATPDGKLLLVKSISGSVSEIYRVDLSDSNAPGGGVGNNLTQITNFGKLISSPCQQTAGGRIFFVMPASNGVSHVFSINADGSGLHQVTGGPSTETDVSIGANTLVVVAKNAANGAGNEDVYTYSLSATTDPGTVSGTLIGALGQPASGVTVSAYDGSTLAGTTVTDANGQYTLSLPPGGYSLQFTGSDVATVMSGATVFSGGSVTCDAVTSPAAAPAPVKVVATVKYPNVGVRWAAAAAPASGYALVGYNVYRGTSMIGPWTKINSTPIPPVNPLQYTDTAPGNIATAFYKMTAVTSNGSTTAESAFTEVSQAASNLVYNGSFENVDANGVPIGWTPQGTCTVGTSTTYSTDGGKSLSMKELASTASMRVTSDVLSSSNKDFVFSPPIQPGVPIVEGMFAKFTDMKTTWPLVFITGPLTSGYSGYWYNPGGIGGTWDTTPGLTNPAGGDTDWIWQANTGPIFDFEFCTATKLVVYWNGDSTATQNSSTCYADDMTYQVKSYGSTGMVFGRIVDETGKGMSGVTVKVGGISLVTSGLGNVIIPNVPTGEQTMTISVPHKPDVTTTIHNYGGCRFEPFTVTNPGPFTIDGHVYYPDGKPCVGADVRFVKTDDSDNEVQYSTTTTDATGYYTFGSGLDDVASTTTGHVIAHMNGYVSNRIDKKFGAAGWSVNNDLKLIQPNIVIQAGKTSTPPTIDGTLSTGEWAASQVIPFAYSSLYATPQNPTTGYVMWDNDNLYLAFACAEPNPSGIVTSGFVLWGSDPFWIGHDLTEIRLDPTNGAAAGLAHEWWQILLDTVSCTSGITSNASNWDQHWLSVANRKAGNSLWDANAFLTNLRSAVSIGASQWVQEVKIPWSDLSYSSGMTVNTPTVGDEWACSLGRGRTQPSTAMEYTCTDNRASGNGIYNGLLRFVNTVTAPAKGDLNGDGVVNSFDAIASLRIAAGLEAVGARINQADVNNDAKADLSDTVKIVRKINGKDSF